MKKVLTIAGSDSSGGAGIQADMKTISAHGMYAMSVITALTAQNTMGVSGIFPASGEFVAQQIDSVFTDIYPDAVKIGMLSSREIISNIAERLRFYKAKNIVLDPVMVSTSGSRLISEDAQQSVLEELMPIADVITPNVPEAEVLSGIKIENKEDMQRAAKLISGTHNCAVLVKGGHMVETATDILFKDGRVSEFVGNKIDNPNTHGTGCTLSSAIACALAAGKSCPEAVKSAKHYLEGALSSMLDLGEGRGPVDHLWCLEKKDRTF